jgi:hypothetical protein
VVSEAGQDKEEREFGQAGLAESGGEAEGIGDLFEDEEQAEYGAAGGERVEVVEVAAEGALEGEDAGGAEAVTNTAFTCRSIGEASTISEADCSVTGVSIFWARPTGPCS